MWVIGNPGHNPASVTHRFLGRGEKRIAVNSGKFTVNCLERVDCGPRDFRLRRLFIQETRICEMFFKRYRSHRIELPRRAFESWNRLW